MYIDKRMLYVVMAIMIISGIASYITDTSALLNLLLTIPGLLIAITFHEFAHAFAADKLGDDTPRLQGRLTLNPLGHLDPVGSVMLLFAGFGWGKPVEVNPRNYDRRFSMEKAEAIVSIAGPLMNFFLAIALTIIYCALYKFTNIAGSQVGIIILMMINSPMVVYYVEMMVIGVIHVKNIIVILVIIMIQLKINVKLIYVLMIQMKKIFI